MFGFMVLTSNYLEFTYLQSGVPNEMVKAFFHIYVLILSYTSRSK